MYSLSGCFERIFTGYVYKKSQSKKLQSLKHKKRTLLNYAFYGVFGVCYGLVSQTSLVLLFSTILFVDSLAIGSFIKLRKKDVWEYIIPFSCYVLVGLIMVGLVQWTVVWNQFL